MTEGRRTRHGRDGDGGNETSGPPGRPDQAAHPASRFELARHGYTLSPGTLYPMLHALGRRGYLKSRKERQGRTCRRLYRATAMGREADKICKVQVRELTGQGRNKAQEQGEAQRSRAKDETGPGAEHCRNGL